MKPWLLLAVVVLLVPVVAGQSPGVDVRQYQAFVLTESGTTGAVPETNLTVEDVHSWESLGGQSVLEVRAAYVTQSGGVMNPQADFQVVWNGTNVEECRWHIQGGTVSGARSNPYLALFCILPAFVEPGNHTIEVARSNVTGTPVVDSTTSIILHQTESIEMDITVASAFDEFLPYLFWGGLALFFLAKRAYAPAIASTVMVIGSTLTTPLWSFAFGVLLVLLTLWIHVIGRHGVFAKGVKS